MKTPPVATLAASILLLLPLRASAQCTELATGLREPLGTTLTNQGNLLVSESGTPTPRSGRVSIIDMNGNRRTLIDGLPSAINDVGDPSGPSGLFMRGRTLYLNIGSGDEGLAGPSPGTNIPNPNPTSQIFSSVLVLQFSASFEQTTTGVTLSTAQEQALANGETVFLTNDGRDFMSVRVLVNFPDYVAFPTPQFANNVQLSNPYDLVAVEDTLYVTDGARNRVWQVDLLTGAFSTLVTFPNIPNPLFGAGPGGPFEQAVPTGISFFRGQLFVTLFRGAPFATGTSTVVTIDRVTGSASDFITGRTAAIDVLPVAERGATSYFVLQFATAGPFFQGPGLLLRFSAPGATPVVVADCLSAPASMTLDTKRGALYISEVGGRIVRIAVPAEAGFTPSLRNVSARGRVATGENVLIGGFIIGEGTGGSPANVIVRAIGPSLSKNGLAQALPDPVLTLHDSNGMQVARNDNWKGDAGQPSQQTEIAAAGLAPSDDRESAILASLAPGNYTAIIAGKGADTGVALVEIYSLD